MSLCCFLTDLFLGLCVARADTMNCLTSVALVAASSYWLLFLIIPLFYAFHWVRVAYVSSSRSLKRLDGTTRSPIFAHFGVVLAGLPVIRAFTKESAMMARCLAMIDVNTRMYMMFQYASRWIGFSLDFCVTLVVAATTTICIVVSS